MVHNAVVCARVPGGVQTVEQRVRVPRVPIINRALMVGLRLEFKVWAIAPALALLGTWVRTVLNLPPALQGQATRHA